VTDRADYTLQLDAQSVGGVSVMDAYVNLGRVPVEGVTLRAGLFPPPFGFELTNSSSVRESPERAFGFGASASDYPIFKTAQSSTGGVVTPGTVLPLFTGQNREVGAMLVHEAPGAGKDRTRVSLGVFNGEGRATGGTRNANDGLDIIARAETTLADGHVGIGVSGYYGTLSVRSGPPAGTPLSPVAFRRAHRMLGGMDVRWRLSGGTQIRAEWAGGVFEATPDRALYLENNHAYAWNAVVRHPLSGRLDVVAKYDEYYPIAQTGRLAGGLGRMDLVRKTAHLGLLYHLDPATRFRLWYMQGLTPYDPSAGSGPLRRRLGLLTGEILVSY